MKTQTSPADLQANEFSLAGQFLIAMPSMQDPHFSGALVYLCEHSSKGAMGLIVNKSAKMAVLDLLQRVQLSVSDTKTPWMPVMVGGPVAAERGFVLHSRDAEAGSSWDSSFLIDDHLAITTSKDILEALALGTPPSKWLIALGYSGWSEGQLERELAANAWMTVSADLRVLFDVPLEQRFAEAWNLLGIDPLMLSGVAGHA